MSRKQVLVSLVTLVVLVSGLMAACAAPAPALPKSAIVNLRSSPFGTGGYIIGTCMEESSRNHPWLNIAHTESPGGVWNSKYIAQNPKSWGTMLVQINAFLQWSASNGTGKFEEVGPLPEILNVVPIMNYTIGTVHFVTFDPDIKTMKDLEGKSLATGRKTQGIYCQVNDPVINDILKVDVEEKYLGPTEAVQALMDGIVDAAIVGLYWPGDMQAVAPGDPYLRLIGQPKKVYHIDWTQEVKEPIKDYFEGAVQTFNVAAGTLENQPEPFTVIGHPQTINAHLEMPEEVVSEFVRLTLDNYEEWYPVHNVMRMITPETLVYGIDPEAWHPGAVKVYRERGLLE